MADDTIAEAQTFVAPVDTTCTINVWNVQNWPLDPEMLVGVLNQCASRYIGEARTVDVYPTPARDPMKPGDNMQEWLLRVNYRSGTTLTIGVVQRAPGLEVEFHS